MENKFVDKEFPANDTVLPSSKRNIGILWKRPSEISQDVKLFAGSAKLSDPQQGELGDCWLVSSLALVAGSGNNRIEKLFVTSDFEQGKHSIRFYKDFSWVTIEIDDLLPCNSEGKLLFARNVAADSFWVPLVEKAYAKLHNGYQHIESGLIADGLRDLTGDGVEVINCTNYINKKSVGLDDLWATMQYNSEQQFPMGCAISVVGSPPSLLPTGLLVNHAYSVTLCKEFSGNKLIRINNPWGEQEWKGAWSDAAAEWKPEILELVDHKFKQDGVFFMEFKDFIANFNIIYVLRLTREDVDSWTRHAIKGEWKEGKSGGESNWLYNPQFTLSTENSNNKVVVCLSQPDQRGNNTNQYHEIGIIILQKNGRKLESQFCARRDLSYEFNAQCGGSYIIIPLTYNANIKIPFELSVYSLFAVSVKEIPSTEESFSENGQVIEGLWIGKSAGGSAMYESFIENPQYNLIATKNEQFEILLEQYGNTESIGVFVVEVPKPGVRLDPDFDDDVVKFQADLSVHAIRGTFEVEAGKVYCIVPFTFRPHTEGRFRLSIPGVTLSPIL